MTLVLQIHVDTYISKVYRGKKVLTVNEKMKKVRSSLILTLMYLFSMSKWF